MITLQEEIVQLKKTIKSLSDKISVLEQKVQGQGKIVLSKKELKIDRSTSMSEILNFKDTVESVIDLSVPGDGKFLRAISEKYTASLLSMSDILAGALTQGYVPYFNTSVWTNSPIFTNGIDVGINTIVPTIGKLHIVSVAPTAFTTIPANTAAIGYINSTTGWAGQGFLFGATADNNAFGLVYNGTNAYFGKVTNAAQAAWIMLTQYGIQVPNGGAAAPSFSFQNDPASGMYLMAASQIGLVTGGVDRIIILSNGNVGIMKSNPVATLDVYGSINIRDNYNLTWGGAYGAGIPTISAISGASSFIAIYPAGSTSGEKFRIDKDGKVGIINTNPQYTLDITGNLRVSTGFGCNGTLPQTAYASGGVATTSAGDFGFASDAERAALTTLVANIRLALVANGIMS